MCQLSTMSVLLSKFCQRKLTQNKKIRQQKWKKKRKILLTSKPWVLTKTQTTKICLNLDILSGKIPIWCFKKPGTLVSKLVLQTLQGRVVPWVIRKIVKDLFLFFWTATLWRPGGKKCRFYSIGSWTRPQIIKYNQIQEDIFNLLL